MTRACRPLLVLCTLLAVLESQDIQEVSWGFDGRAVAGRFNVVSVYVHNASAQPFDGTIRLHKCDPFGGRLDAPIEEPCHLSPASGRWVQFYPFVTTTDDAWEVVCGRTREQVSSLRAGRPALVLLEPDNPGAPLAGVPSFAAARFPPFVAATEGLSGAVLDHVPAWDGSRRAAFLDWLRGGGRLHLLRAFGGELRFSGELAVLNDPSPSFHVGQGVVVRHPCVRAQFGAQQRRESGVLPPRSADDEVPQPLQAQLLDRLRAVIEPHHDWGVIFLAAFFYLVLVGPLHWALARRWNDYRWSSLALLALVALFCWFFMELGARGYGEQQQVSTIGYARDLGDDAWRVTLYSDVFATSGDVYRISHAAEHALYSAAQEHEQVRGVIRNGRQGSFAVDIPLFSNRSFVCAARFSHPSLRLAVKHWPATSAAGELTSFSARIEGPFPETVLAIHLMHMGQLWSARREGDDLVGTGPVQAVGEGLGLSELREGSLRNANMRRAYRVYDDGARDGATTMDAVAKSLLAPLLVERLGLLAATSNRPDLDDAERIQVFVLAKAPEAFALRCRGLERNESYVVFHTDLIKER